jgi:hypothetical protein
VRVGTRETSAATQSRRRGATRRRIATFLRSTLFGIRPDPVEIQHAAQAPCDVRFAN